MSMRELYNAIEMDFKENKSHKYREMDMLGEWEMPDWMEEDPTEPLWNIYLQQERFFSEGQIVISCVVQANTLLFKGFKDDCPANFIYTREPYYYENPEELSTLASKLYSLKGERAGRRDLQFIADALEDEMERFFRIPLPDVLTEGRTVFITSVMVHRRHIPKRKLSESFYPLLTIDCEDADAMILPKWYWSDRVKTYYKKGTVSEKRLKLR